MSLRFAGHQCVRGRGGAISVLYETHWNGILRPTWERKLDLQAFRHLILAYWANGPDHHQPNTRQYQQLTQPRARLPAPKVNATSRVPTDSLLTTSIAPAFYPLLCLLEPPFGTIPLMVSDGSVKSSNPPMSSDATSYGSSTTQALP